ncbi:PREDICTED: LOW QUALITY PROTEIN: inactive pancreatic lipase-related protein 1-like [Priapulus caudatus]|uniref:LOW QUALITY PROTEIN: inactive pancreatic lipase-related protein 1-like n=1 Tax=Priapulus caudatus TaxID=37621 RepID=A0ABM1DW78_PRICU|nr:PREDICTED: LOW QUALITY PROTEIN: inactive pancreatic lipase-related protein 1-like [Priapulus caudatus]
MLLLFVSAFFVVQAVLGSPLEHQSRTVCHDQLGCFPTGGSFSDEDPWPPEEIGTDFWLYTRRNPVEYQIMDVNMEHSISASYWDKLNPTKILVHGFQSSGTSQWLQDMRDKLLLDDDYNVIVVDWKEGASAGLLHIDYSQSVANTRVVGAQIAQLVHLLTGSYGASASDFHIIGHSLGAHIGGYAGERIPNLARISVLDPTGPCFENNPEARLDSNDAIFVDVIHTGCGWSFDNQERTFQHYFKYNRDVPQEADIGCSHGRSHDLFTDSIDSGQPLLTYACSSYAAFLAGECIACENGGCATLGLHADLYAANLNVFHEKLQVFFGRFESEVRGLFKGIFTGSGGTSGILQVGE